MIEREIKNKVKEINVLLDSIHDWLSYARDEYEKLAIAEQTLTDILLDLQVYGQKGEDNADD